MKKTFAFFACTIMVILCSICGVAETQDLLVRPQDVDGGYWIGVYKDFLDNISEYNGIAALADFDLDGKPELLALSGEWVHVGLAGCFVKYDGSDFIVYEDIALIGVDEQLALTVDGNGHYGWYSISENAGAGLFSSAISRVKFSESMELSEEKWLSSWGEWNDDMTESNTTYYIGDQEVSYEQYRKEDVTRKQLRTLFVLDPWNFMYPDSWYDTTSQYSVIQK